MFTHLLTGPSYAEHAVIGRKKMKLALNELHPNPFKKEINKGKMNEEQIKKLLANLDKLNLMGAIPVVKRDNKYCLVSHHHRVEALKRKFGKNHEVEVVVHKYDDDQLLRGMIIENLTQRTDEFHEVTDNLLAIENYLNKNPKVLATLRESRNVDTARFESKDKAVARDIAKWLDNNSGDVMSHDKITNCLNIKKNLDPELYKQIKNTQAGTANEREEALQETQAVYLARIDDKEEQKDLAHALKSAKEQRVRNQGKLLSEYKKSSNTTKKKVRSGKIKLDDVPIENIKEQIKEKIEETKGLGKIEQITYKKFQEEAGTKVGTTNDNIVQTCVFLNALDKSGVLFELDWKTMLMIVNAGTEYGENYVKFMKRITENIK